MKTIVYMRYLFALFLGVVLTCYAGVASLDSIVAIVNEGVITQSQLDANVKLHKQELLRQSAYLPDDATFVRQVLDRLILEEIQLQMAKRSGLEVDENALDAMIDGIANSNKMTVVQFREVLSHEGIEYANFRNRIQRQAVISH